MRSIGRPRSVTAAVTSIAVIGLMGCAITDNGNDADAAGTQGAGTQQTGAVDETPATEDATPTDGPDRGSAPTAPVSEQALPQDDPTGDVPFPANREPDTAEPSDSARLSPTGMRFGVHRQFDRLVIDLSGPGEPGWTAAYVEEPTAAGSGEPVTLGGDAALELTIEGVALPTEEGAEPWTGAEEIAPQSGGVITEVVRGPLYEGRQQVFVGLEENEPFRVFSLEDPTRVVLDVYHPGVEGGPLPGDPPEDEMPFPANLQPDTRETGEGARLSPVDLRFGYHRQFDRVVLDLAGSGLPGWRGEYVEDPRLAGSGAQLELDGDAALRVSVDGLIYPTEDDARDYHGPQRFTPDPAGVVEEVVYGSIYEGQAEIYVGLSSREPFRVFLLEDPHPMVVVDVVHPSVTTRDCGDVGFEPNTDAGAFNIEAAGVGCRVARQVAGAAEGQSGERYGARNFDCRPTGTVGMLPSVQYECARGDAVVTFDAS